MKRGIAMLAAAAVILWLPEADRLDLLTVAVLVYAAAFYLVGCLCGMRDRVKTERERLMGLRWVRRDPPKIPNLKGYYDGHAFYAPSGIIWFEWPIRKGKA